MGSEFGGMPVPVGSARWNARCWNAFSIQNCFCRPMEAIMQSFARLSAYAAEHPALRSAREISVWAWIAGVVVVLIVLAAVLTPSLREKNAMLNHPLLPLATDSGLDIPNPNI
jgi:hypothetical protein